MKIEQIELKKLIPYVNNPRKHPESQIKKLMASLKEFGFVLPILIDAENRIIAGHGVVEAAQRLGEEIKTAPCIRAEKLSERQQRAYLIADNRLAEESNWDKEALSVEMLRLRDDFKINLGITGFSKREILSLKLDSIGGAIPEDDLPDMLPEQVTQPGDMWLLGEHRLICGDCTDCTVVEKLLDGDRPHLMVTDPPYGVKYDPTWRNNAGISESKRVGRVLNDDRADWSEAWELFPGDVVYIWHGSLYGLIVAESLRICGFSLRSQIVWAKPSLVLGRGDIHWQHETCWYAVRRDDAPCPDMPGYCAGYDQCWYAVREKERSHWQGARNVSTLWNDIDYVGAQDNATTHSTQKPVEVMRRPMLNNSEPGEYIYEPFCGSGTTIIAAQSCRRKCLAVELNPAYVDMAVRRWQDYTSKSAVLSGVNKTFDKMKKARR